MQRLKVPAPASTRSRAVSVTEPRATISYRSDNLPPVRNIRTDVELPKLWSSWIPSNGPREIRRALTSDERVELERRRAELEPAVAPFRPEETDRVALALADMFGGYPSLRLNDEDAVGKLDSARRLLADYPAWAIEQACRAIHENGVWRGGRFDRQWPPSDAEIIAAVREAVRLYKRQYDNVVGLLTAEVES